MSEVESNNIVEHIPSFCDGVEGRELEFKTTEELLESTWLKRWADHPFFCGFSLSDNRLMAVRDDGFEWWVVGYVNHPELVNLPKWDGGKYFVDLDGEETVLDSKDVSSVCGDEVELNDGRIAKELKRPEVGDRDSKGSVESEEGEDE